MSSFISLTVFAVLFCFSGTSGAQSSLKVGLMKYSGGGDWYANPTSLPNLIAFCNSQVGMNIE
ncbi:MAG: DUF4159 domain-containing protein [Bacteroidales bacterium]|nr:DUF4159 domain-containing protein [Bacteroidales bacterium]